MASITCKVRILEEAFGNLSLYLIIKFQFEDRNN